MTALYCNTGGATWCHDFHPSFTQLQLECCHITYNYKCNLSSTTNLFSCLLWLVFTWLHFLVLNLL